jgi:peptidoglycan hydrolase FlgJ
MATASIMSPPGLGALDALAGVAAKAPKLSLDKTQNLEKAKSTAQDFESVFLNNMFQQMFTGLDGEGPFGGSGATGVWRSFLTDEYSKSFAKAGGIGITNEVYRSLIAHQGSQS